MSFARSTARRSNVLGNRSLVLLSFTLALQINAGQKTASVKVQAWHESEAGVLNAEVTGNFSATVKLTAVSSAMACRVR